MVKKKLNCWEYMKCERGPGGKKIAEHGICPASSEDTFDGINEGENAGRVCWAVAGTCCGGKIQGTFAEKRVSCTTCDFYQHVQKEEGAFEKINKLFDILPAKERESLFSRMRCRVVKAGERLIKQGEIRDSAFIIQRGSCLVIVEKQGELHPVDHRGIGDIVGVTSILTGEPQIAHVDAETDMELWILKAPMLNDISLEHPDLSDFLTEIVASRFDSMRPIADRTISKYIASDIIGRGAFSIVYKGLHTDLNMPVAIKMLKHDMAMNPDFFAPFKAEAKILAKLNHQNIVKVYDIEERYRTVFIMMEYLTGNTLKLLLQSTVRFSNERVISFLIQICNGLHHAHQSGIVHQDIKPGNIFILPNDKVKILDFGLACPTGSENFLAGTPFYMSPEQVRCLPVDPRSDIYSLGLVVYRMVTGRKPFDGDDLWKVMEMRTECDVLDPAEIVPDIPGPLRGFILKACARDPNKRYHNIPEALATIKSLAEEYGLVNGESYKPKRKMQIFYLVHEDSVSQMVSAIVNELSTKMQHMGAELKTGELLDL